MEGTAVFFSTLNTSNWIAIIAVCVAIISTSFTAANYLAGRRERRLQKYEAIPAVKATINAKRYEDGWRSVQLHVVARPGYEQNFQYKNWRIEKVRLLFPWRAVLARALNDDYATGTFYPERPVRRLDGKPEGRPQRFALEFFIKFKGPDKGKKAKFCVTYSHVGSPRRARTVRLRAAVPSNAE